jgi:hypothetical protein
MDNLQTAFHRLVFNESGANLYEANMGDELPEEGYTGQYHWHTLELLQIADFVNEHRDPTGCATSCIFALRCLHRLVQCSGFLSAKGPKIPLHYEDGRAMKNALKPNHC